MIFAFYADGPKKVHIKVEDFRQKLGLEATVKPKPRPSLKKPIPKSGKAPTRTKSERDDSDPPISSTRSVEA